MSVPSPGRKLSQLCRLALLLSSLQDQFFSNGLVWDLRMFPPFFLLQTVFAL